MSGVNTGALRPEMAAIAVPTTTDGGNMDGRRLLADGGLGALRAGGGRHAGPRARCGASVHGEGAGGPGQRDRRPRQDATFDIHLNDRAYWRNVPAAVWSYKLGGYQVLKKWLSYQGARRPGPGAEA